MADRLSFKHAGHAAVPTTRRRHWPGSVGAGVWDRALDGIATKPAAEEPLTRQLLILMARLGLSLFITAGFAAGLCLITEISVTDPNSVRACEGVFFWSLALVSSVTGRRP
jgi:hypothetical protein